MTCSLTAYINLKEFNRIRLTNQEFILKYDGISLHENIEIKILDEGKL